METLQFPFPRVYRQINPSKPPLTVFQFSQFMMFNLKQPDMLLFFSIYSFIRNWAAVDFWHVWVPNSTALASRLTSCKVSKIESESGLLETRLWSWRLSDAHCVYAASLLQSHTHTHTHLYWMSAVLSVWDQILKTTSVQQYRRRRANNKNILLPMMY